MKITQTKNGTITMTANSKKDSLELLKILSGSSPDPERTKMIQDKENELKNSEPKICYKSNEPCKYNCQGLCKESV